MTDLGLTPTGAPTDKAAAGTLYLRTLVGLELYVVTAYVSAAVIPYLWRDHPEPPTWIWIVPAWLLGVPGFGITLLGTTLAVPLALVGAGATTLRYRAMPTGLRRWCVSAAVLTGAYALFSFTPLAKTIAVWVID